jgi:hypothetical protein
MIAVAASVSVVRIMFPDSNSCLLHPLAAALLNIAPNQEVGVSLDSVATRLEVVRKTRIGSGLLCDRILIQRDQHDELALDKMTCPVAVGATT